MPKVSVIVPVYNVEKYLGECLDSILGQTLRAIEVICVDDGSTDGSATILDAYAARDGRVKVIHQPNAGAGAARNAGIAAATGEYLLFCDPDDWCDRRMLKALYAKAQACLCDVVVTGMVRHDGVCATPYYAYPSKRLVSKKCPFAGRDAADFIFLDALANPVNKLVRRAFVVGQGISFQEQKRENDLFFSYMTVALAERIAVSDDACYHYRMARPGSIQYEGRVDGQPLLWIDAVKAVKCRLEDMGLLKPFAFGLLKVLLGTGLRNMLKFLRHEDIQLFYGALRDEARALEGVCADRLEGLSDYEASLWRLLVENESPLPVVATIARYYKAKFPGGDWRRASSIARTFGRLSHWTRKTLPWRG